jgi:DNA-binding NarL/FixJ family response regulator
MINILLADDHKIMRDGLRAILEGQKEFNIVGEASDGFETIKLAKQLNPDIILMDIHMPLLNGIDAARKILLDSPEIRIVILSMHATKEHIFQALKAGAKGYLLKETSGIEVVEAIREVVAGDRYLSQMITEAVIDDYVFQRSQAVVSSPLDRLSNREREVMQLVVEGKNTTDISTLLHLSKSTVSTYRSRIMKKLGTKDIADLVRFAIEHKLITTQ